MKDKVKYSLTKKVVLWILQINVGVIFLRASVYKLLGLGGSVELFNIIMGPNGRLFVGILELLIAILLLSWRFSATGALLGIAIMIGAVIAHVTVLGISSSLMAFLLLVLCVIIFIMRRREVPLIGEQL